ncbi:PilN domain-containing protein [Anaerosoma tenue]|uniref:PilN domain-containing protein n=1 Tax=Anaerosoma tenue TaxID=2933588 RepID=UPI0022609FEF|nr:PilN domain-containing protein [Anaerosoma tenue]MCK8114410.1 PilN domain-containing protein [Anaerosoma tenue]
MMRVNLLPPEILERRQAERRIIWVVVAAIVIAVLLAGVWGVANYRLQNKKDELAAVQQEAQAIQAQADQLAIFETRASELEERQATVQAALGGRIDWAKLLDEVSLVLPSDLWVQTMAVDEDAGISLAGYAIDSPDDVPDLGHKAIAKALVRLADLEDLSDVWLASSVKTEFAEQDAIQYTITSKVVPPATEGEAE